MKKLMILGGSHYIIPVIKKAQELGIYVITCDYLENNIAHKYSNEYINVSIVEKEKVLEEAKAHSIDGIISFACDPGVTTAAYVAEKLNLPKSGPYESVCILQNKGLFRNFLKDNGFNVPNAKSYHDVKEALKDIDYFNFPVIVKPTDSAGSKGVTKVLNPKDLEKSIKYALSYSLSKEFIIEDFLEKEGDSSDSDSFLLDGELKYVSFSSQKFDKNAKNSYVPAAYSWPASLSCDEQENLKSEIGRLLSLLKMETTLLNIETRKCTNGKCYIMECSPRGGGNRLSEMMELIDGVNLIENTILGAIGLPLKDFKVNKSNYYWCEVILHGSEKGIFDKLEIDNIIKNNVYEEDLWIKKGDMIDDFTGANASVGTLILRFEKKENMDKILNNIDKYIKVRVIKND